MFFLPHKKTWIYFSSPSLKLEHILLVFLHRFFIFEQALWTQTGEHRTAAKETFIKQFLSFCPPQTLLTYKASYSTWLLILLLSPNTSHPPTQAARKEWDWTLFPWIFCCKTCSPLYVNTKQARFLEWVYVAFKMARSLSFKLQWE